MKSFQVQASSKFSQKGSRPFQEDEIVVDRKRNIFIVSDGFGGPIAGRAAAKESCEAVHRFIDKEAGDLDATLPFVLRNYFSLCGNVLFNALIHANRVVGKMNKGKTVNERGGASVIAGYLDGNLLAIANIGCCGASLFREGKKIDLVLARSYARLWDAGTQLKGMDIPMMAIGLASDIEPEIVEYRVKKGDWCFFHSDGIDDETLAKIESIQADSALTPEEGLEQVQALIESTHFDDNASGSLIVV